MTTNKQEDAHATTEPAPNDAAILVALRAGDEATFTDLVAMYSGAMLRVARMYVHNAASAEEVVQDAWLGLLQALDRFEGRSSLKTYLFRIVVNCAKTRARKDARTIPFSAAFEPDDDQGGASVPPERFQRDGAAAGSWSTPPKSWAETPERSLLSSETRRIVEDAVDSLPANQREVITLRDIEGWDAADVCNALGLSETNQRVLLHRARAKVRLALEQYFDGQR